MTVGATQLPGLEAAAQEMPFDQFGRYHMLREAVDACRAFLEQDQLSILDVGGYYEQHGEPTLPLKRFLPADDLTVLDVVECELPGYVQGDGTRLDFADASFDLVVSADTLEHIPQPQRAAFWRELLRVARHGVLLLAPFGSPETDDAEELLFEYIKIELRAEHDQLKEHREYGLPVLDEWLSFLEDQGIAARAYPTGYLPAWLGMMLIKHMLLRVDSAPKAQMLLDSFYNRAFFPTERRRPAYRYLVVAPKTAGLLDAVDAAIAPTLMPDREDLTADWGEAMVPTMLAVLQRQTGAMTVRVDEEVAYQKGLVEYLQHHLDHYKDALEQARQHVSALERVLADQQIAINQLHQQTGMLAGQMAEAFEQQRKDNDVIIDLTERSRWLEEQNTHLRQQLAAIEQGKVMRVLRKLP